MFLDLLPDLRLASIKKKFDSKNVSVDMFDPVETFAINHIKSCCIYQIEETLKVLNQFWRESESTVTDKIDALQTFINKDYWRILGTNACVMGIDTIGLRSVFKEGKMDKKNKTPRAFRKFSKRKFRIHVRTDAEGLPVTFLSYYTLNADPEAAADADDDDGYNHMAKLSIELSEATIHQDTEDPRVITVASGQTEESITLRTEDEKSAKE